MFVKNKDNAFDRFSEYQEERAYSREEIEIEVSTNIKKLIPEALFIFIMPPSLKTLIKRLKKRGTESNDKIIKRFHEAYKEINEVTKYNYVVVNDELEEAISKVEAIIKAENLTVSEEEIDEEIKAMAESYGKEFDEVKELLAAYRNTISGDLLMRKAVAIIRDSSK